ncbi:MAG TPA: YceI family protein [Vicinamibacterales bacterium]|nr:YceI family protein [Vicinamibacterales bacterium]
MILALLLLLVGAETYHVDPARSTVTIEVGKAGAFSFMAGHTHEVVGPVTSGTVTFDREHPERSRVQLAIATKTLKVSGKNEPGDDVPKVQERMDGPDVLAIDRYPEIKFESTGILAEFTVNGRLTIRDVSRAISVPVHVEQSADGLRVTGRFSVKQSEFGIKPISVGGVVAVKDALSISFAMVARR